MIIPSGKCPRVVTHILMIMIIAVIFIIMLMMIHSGNYPLDTYFDGDDDGDDDHDDDDDDEKIECWK